MVHSELGHQRRSLTIILLQLRTAQWALTISVIGNQANFVEGNKGHFFRDACRTQEGHSVIRVQNIPMLTSGFGGLTWK